MMCFSIQKLRDDMLLTYKFLFNVFFFHVKVKRLVYEFISIWEITSLNPFAQAPQVLCNTFLEMQVSLSIENKTKQKKDTDNFGRPELPVCWVIFICELNYIWIIKTDRNKINSH